MLRYHQRVASHDLSFGLNYGRTDVEGGDYSHDGGVPTGLMTIVDNDATGLELYALDRWQLSERVQLELGAQGVLADRNVVSIDAVKRARGTERLAAPRAHFEHPDGEILSLDDPLAPGTSLSANIDATVHAGIEAVLGAELALVPVAG
jgi:hypothetical protein